MGYIFDVGMIFKAEDNAAAIETNKLIGNSVYGVNLKRPIDTEYTYKPAATNALKKAKTLPNGQVEYE